MIWLAAGIASIALRGGQVVSAGLDGKVRSKEVIASRPYELYAVAANKDHLAFCGNSTEINVDKRTFKLPAGWCLALAFSPDGRTLAVGTSEKQAFLFDVSSGKVARTLQTKWTTAAVAWSPDGKTLALAEFHVSLWNASDGKQLHKMVVDEAILGVAFSPDGSLLAGVGRDKLIHIWSTASGQATRTIDQKGFIHFVGDRAVDETISVPLLAVDFSPDGKTLATGGADRLVRVWDVESGKELRRFEGHRAAITAVRFLDANHLVSGSLDGTIKTWALK